MRLTVFVVLCVRENVEVMLLVRVVDGVVVGVIEALCGWAVAVALGGPAEVPDAVGVSVAVAVAVRVGVADCVAVAAGDTVGEEADDVGDAVTSGYSVHSSRATYTDPCVACVTRRK